MATLISLTNKSNCCYFLQIDNYIEEIQSKKGSRKKASKTIENIEESE